MLHLVHGQTSALVEHLKAFDLSGAPSRTTSAAEQLRAMGGIASTAVPVAIAHVLDTAMEELFSREIVSYLDRESRSLGELFAAFLNRFARYHVRCFAKPFSWLTG